MSMCDLPEVDVWAARIAACWRESVEAILAVGRLLAQAKAALPHGEFGAMVTAKLPFGERTAQMLMAISADPRLTDPKRVSVLPPSWGTLYELHKLPDERLDAAFDYGLVRPDMERREVALQAKQERRETRERDLGAKQSALPQKRYGVILADPEWRFEPWSRQTGLDRAADNHYPTSCTEVIAARDVPSIAAHDCVLFLCGTAPMLPHALLVMDAWGFEYKSNYVLMKDRPITGYWNRNKHEHLLIGTKGKPPCPAPGTQWESIIAAPVGEHSEKPETIHEMIERYFPTMPKMELNRRGAARAGWDAWGNEAENSSASLRAPPSKPAPSAPDTPDNSEAA